MPSNLWVAGSKPWTGRFIFYVFCWILEMLFGGLPTKEIDFEILKTLAAINSGNPFILVSIAWFPYHLKMNKQIHLKFSKLFLHRFLCQCHAILSTSKFARVKLTPNTCNLCNFWAKHSMPIKVFFTSLPSSSPKKYDIDQ